MSERGRLLLFVAGAAGFAALLLWGLAGLPAFGDYRGPYGDVINASAVAQRHLTNMASAINFDYRGFDTLGEEYILFTAVTGLALLLREIRSEIEEAPRDASPNRDASDRSDALRWFGLMLAGFTNLFGLYVVIHAHLTPGGGFQGGAILGTACLLVYLAIGYRAFRTVSPKVLMDFADATGAGGYALIGLGTLLAGGAFLQNMLPLGQTGDLLSAGTVPVINLVVGLEVSGGFILMFAEFLKETRKPSREKDA
ncbi:MAG TPA: MnhB domain-containing protein [Gemmataceae bacterium]|nr:MnhB domain-containing protein [Gemmataceae bacterium]